MSDRLSDALPVTVRDLSAMNPHCEYAPADFDYSVAIFQARAFFTTVREVFPEASLDDQVQDATYHAGISVGGAEIRLSNFERLATITSAEILASETQAQLLGILEWAGYRYVPLAVFGEPFLTRERFTGDLFNQLFDYV